MGIPAKARKFFETADEPIVVYPENWPAVMLFQALRTQWVYAGMGALVGLNYAAIPVAESRIGIAKKDREAAFLGVQVLESETIRIAREKGRKKAHT